ncbi:MAG TPA: FKBP-type peptidyl-prolyl cis-trans isomerase [Actinophytocola sp.]|jgi:peptidylprolyl isomerase|nr:FKBP-type peptidyl-prolyl cis-trans isomerase [Actinophytocola sp.]
MRNVSKIVVVTALAVSTALSLAGCVNREQPSSQPPGETESFPAPSSEQESAPPSETSEPGAPGSSGVSTAVECTAADIKVAGSAGKHPEITVPKNCSAPTKLIVKDLAPGSGPAAKKGAQLQAHYALTAWSTGQEVETSYGQQPLDVPTVGSGLIEAWNQGLVGMKQGGRRLIVAPPDLAYAGSGNELQDETLVFVIDAVKVTPAA